MSQQGKQTKSAKSIQATKDKLLTAARHASPGTRLGQACWGYFAPDVLNLIDDHTRLEVEIMRLSQTRA